MKKNLKAKKYLKPKGITLIALVITIIVLLILAGVSIATLTGDNGILTRASDAKIKTAVATVKENLQLEQIEKTMDEEEVTPETLLAEGKVKRTVQEGEDGNYYMYYALVEDALEGMQGLGKGNLSSLKDVFLIDDDLNLKYIASNGKEYGDNINNKILEDETEIRFANEAFSEYISKISGITEDEMKFKWMKNQTSLTLSSLSMENLEDLVFFPNLIKLSLINCGTLKKLDGIENCKILEEFLINGTYIGNYDAISKLPSLKRFSSDGQIINFDNMIDNLKLIYTLNNINISSAKQIESMKRISELTNNLEFINISGTSITKIEGLENKTNLIEANFSDNKITKIEGLDTCVKLNKLSLKNNNISKIEGLEKLEDLKELYLSNNQIKDILILDKNINLITLDIQNNSEIRATRQEYTEEENKRLDKIQEILTLRNGKIQIDIDKIGLFTGYKTLQLNNQGITNLEFLEGQTSLTSLDLTNNNITLKDEKSQNILKSMQNLTNLGISNNPIETLSPINELRQLKNLGIIGIPNNNDLSEIEDVISNVSIYGLNQELINTIVNCDESKLTSIRLDRRYL